MTVTLIREWVCSRCGDSTRRGRTAWAGLLILCDRCTSRENQMVIDLDPLQARADAIHLGDRAEDENVRLTRERFNPDQVAVINEAFTPSAAEIDHAQAVIDIFAANPEAGTLSLHGKMLDKPHLKQAERVLQIAYRAR